ncbi:SHOCT domain-containing protein [Ornithinimicrobium sediminis]|uniref:SHOCT domain-containing protein n=1 Tax=Ornithinimicrobium sediminis TaxID=2904603 RepID=UPI001E5C7D54|nr:SHOCT domain-containing protein [Ornithinimicrobium sediminis]MCE0487506.1 SHOCT domain-containing protein [Ornithinimicrobium sediminis]
MGLLRMAARTAVISGTATAVSGRVAHRQAGRYQQEAAPQAPAPQYAQPPQQVPVQAPAAAPAEDEAVVHLQNLGRLHAQGVLTDEEFAAAKAKILGI